MIGWRGRVAAAAVVDQATGRVMVEGTELEDARGPGRSEANG